MAKMGWQTQIVAALFAKKSDEMYENGTSPSGAITLPIVSVRTFS
jgi:hypothetical protein